MRPDEALVLAAVVGDEQRERLARVGVRRRPERDALGDRRSAGSGSGAASQAGGAVAGELDDGLVAERSGRAQRVVRVAEGLAVGLEAVLHAVDLGAAVLELPVAAVDAGERRAAARALELLLQPDGAEAVVLEPEDHAVRVHLRAAGHARGR